MTLSFHQKLCADAMNLQITTDFLRYTNVETSANKDEEEMYLIWFSRVIDIVQR